MKRVLLEIVVIVFLVGTAAGMSLTLFRYHIPGVPLFVAKFHYRLMAPFQGYDRQNVELVADGKDADGTWRQINLDPYFPYGRGERSLRAALLSFKFRGKDVQLAAYHRMALRIQELEQERGRAWSSVRLVAEYWPMSSDGYLALRTPANVDRKLLTETP